MRRKLLQDDFPRTLSDFEKRKIAKGIKQNLQLLLPFSRAEPPVVAVGKPLETPPAFPDNISLVLNNLTQWSTITSCHTLSNLVKGIPAPTESLGMDARFIKFINSVQLEECSQETLADLASVVFHVNPSSAKLALILQELIFKRDLRYCKHETLLIVAQIAISIGSPTLNALSQHALNEVDIPLLLELTPHALSMGKMLISPNLIPLLNKSDLIRLVQMLNFCEFPDLIASNLNSITDELTRLSFRRLVTESDRKELLSALFRLKCKLDSLVFIEGNPFYSKLKPSKNYMRKILNTLSADFHHAAISLPLAEASGRMLALTGLNILQLKSVDLIANRLSAFGNNLLIPSAVSSTDFTRILYALTHHPQSWKRRDRFRASIATVLSKMFSLHLAGSRMSSPQIISCVSSLMTIHNKEVRMVAGRALESIECKSISNLQLLECSNHLATLLKHATPTARLETMVKILNAIQIDTLSTPQLVELLLTCKEARVIHRVDQICMSLEQRVSGGSISPTNTAKSLSALGYLQMRGIRGLLSSLLNCLPPSSECHPRLASRLLAGIAAVKIANTDGEEIIQDIVEDLLLSISSKETMREVFSQQLVAADLNKSLLLLGDRGFAFRRHLAAIPAGNDTMVTASEDMEKHSLHDEMLLATSTESVSPDEWKGLLPNTSTLVGDLLGALVDSTSDPESGGFEIAGLRKWRNAELKIQVSIVKSTQCSRDEPRHILGPAATSIAIDRAAGWKVIVLPEVLLDATLARGTDSIKKGVRRAKIIARGENEFDVLLDRFKQVLHSY